MNSKNHNIDYIEYRSLLQLVMKSYNSANHSYYKLFGYYKPLEMHPKDIFHRNYH